ncbi:hypothetical protein [Ralstonia phage phiRSL1]|uniref:Uncharacterized protein n=1 Tax=Ralstonia phage phiRSL1 TaxID=1980924 RepID=B2ZYF2_9CAUD|nr:hypothetical protein RSL1_ORF307 [Ralstonia phage phiRSL1]BAG41753.1 hypothetical protein [Ralstonia phage phiRSL1]
MITAKEASAMFKPQSPNILEPEVWAAMGLLDLEVRKTAVLRRSFTRRLLVDHATAQSICMLLKDLGFQADFQRAGGNSEEDELSIYRFQVSWA